MAVTIKLDKERTIKFDLNALKKFHELTGKSLLKQTTLSDLDEGEIIALVYCGLIHEDKEITVERVGSLVDLNNLVEVISALTKSLAVEEAKTDSDPLATGGPGQS